MVVRTLVVVAALSAAASASTQSISVFESRDRGATSEGDAILATDPDTAYAVAANVGGWARIFPELRAAVVRERRADSIDVELVRRDGEVRCVRFHNRPAGRVVAFEQLGGDAEVSAELVFTPGERAGTTRVHSRLHADVHGFASAFVSGSDLRERRHQQIRENLGRLQAYFARR
jgi:hypothetical protein